MKIDKTVQMIALLVVIIMFAAMSVPIFAGKSKTTSGDTYDCPQVVTYAENPDTLECIEFGTPCDVPAGWVSCQPA